MDIRVHELRRIIREALEQDMDDAIEERALEPEYSSIESFVSSKFDNDETTFDFIDLHALARAIYRRGRSVDKNAEAPISLVKQTRDELEGYGLRFVGRTPTKKHRGHLSNAHGTHPFAGSGGGGSGFSSDFGGGGGFTAFGGGPGAIGGKYAWDANDPKNLGMGAKRRR